MGVNIRSLSWLKRPILLSFLRGYVLLLTPIFAMGAETCFDRLGGDPALPVTSEVLGHFSAGSGKKYREPPNAIELSALAPGQEIYVNPKAFDGFPSLLGRFKKPVRMRVVQIKEIPFGKTRPWKRIRKLIYLESPETGQLAISAWSLAGEIYSEPSFMDYVPFQPEEYVQIGTDSSKSNKYRLLATPNYTMSFTGKAAPYLATFVRVFDEKNFVVKVRGSTVEGLPIDTDFIVPRDEVFGLNTGTVQRFKNRVQSLLAVTLRFTHNEPVRFRRPDGMMDLGTFVRSNNQYTTVRGENGSLIYLAPQSVFKYLGGEPVTETFDADWMTVKQTKPSDLERQFLDGAAKLSSLPDFAAMAEVDQVKTLMQYLMANIRWEKAGISAEMAGLADYNKILCAGAGVCRHLAPLMATVLSETGYSSRLVVGRSIDPKEDGHAWVEVDVKRPEGMSTPFVIDPSGRYIASYAQSAVFASTQRDSFAAKFYTNPRREYISPSRAP